MIGKRRFLLFLCVLASATMLATRTEQTINDGWLFRQGSESYGAMAASSEGWTAVSLPHTWNTDAYRTKDYYQGKAWYKRRLQVPAEWQGRSVFLKFGGVSKWAEVYVNGSRVGEHCGGYTAFTFDITPYLNFGADNEIAVQADNSRQDIAPISADFTFFGGIYRDVWLITTAPIHFDITTWGASGVEVSTPSVSEKSATVRVKSRIVNSGSGNATATLRCRLFGPDGRLVETKNKRIRLSKASPGPSKGGEVMGQTFTVDFAPVANPSLWTPEKPALYRVETEIVDGNGSVLDRQCHHTAFRWFSFSGDKGFFLNGRHYKLRGMCRHQDQAPMGTALTAGQHRRDFRLMKDMGANFVRIAHYPQDEALLEMCDREGMLAWEEIPVVNYVPDSKAYADNSVANLKEMIHQHYNHPSIITWGYMNEILLGTLRQFHGDTLTATVARNRALALRLDSIVRADDPSRWSCMACHATEKYEEWHLADIPQVVGWNVYSGWYGDSFSGLERFMAARHKALPSAPLIVTEYGAGSDLRLHSLHPQRFDFSPEYQQLFIEHYVPVIEQTDYISGASYWNMIDFSSTTRAESMPLINNKGIVTNQREKKDVYYYFKSMWRHDTPVLHIASRDWPWRTGMADTMQTIKVYTNAPTVELRVNGRTVGTKPTANCNAVFSVGLNEGDNIVEALSGDSRDVMTIGFTPVPAVLGDDFKELAVNVGSNCNYTSPHSNMTWVADRAYTAGSWGYVGGKAAYTKDAIVATLEGPLYQTYRKGIEAYRFDCPAGDYELQLLATDADAAMGRMSITVNGQQVEWDAAPATHLQAENKTYRLHTDGNIVVALKATGGSTTLSAIKIRKL